MKHTEFFDFEDLVKVGSKRKWVPMWLWLNVIFRFGLYEVWPISWFTYIKYERANNATEAR
jgi:hypothetical protein